MDFLKGRDGYIKNGISGWKKGRFYRIKTICNGSVNARPRLEPRGEGGNRSVIVGPRLTTRRGNSSRVRGVPLKGSSWWWYDVRVCFARSFRCSLSRWRKVGLPLALWQESRPNFKGLPKVSRVATNHWVFLRCDWSPVSSWFYYQS